MLFLISLMLGVVCVDGLSMRQLLPDGSCTFEGRTYKNNEVIDTNPCRPLQCRNGYIPRLIIDCVNAPCVDYEVRPGDCCATCPNGPNCRLPDGTLLPGDETRILDDDRQCFCMRSYGFGITPNNPDAMCVHQPPPLPKA